MPIQFKCRIFNFIPAGCERIFAGIDKKIQNHSPFLRWLVHITTVLDIKDNHYVLTFSLPQKPTEEQENELFVWLTHHLDDLLRNTNILKEVDTTRLMLTGLWIKILVNILILTE